jgi:hypothetical protein
LEVKVVGGLSFKILSGGGCAEDESDESDESDVGKSVEDDEEGEEERGRLSIILMVSVRVRGR